MGLLGADGCGADAPVRAGGQGASEESSEAPEESPGKQVMDVADFEALLSDQPLAVIETEYVVQNEQYKSLYPDMLQAILQNNTAEDVKDAIVAFVAWDANGLPVKIEGQFDLSDGSYVKKVKYSDINLVSGGTHGEDSGFLLNEHCKIDTFKAIVVSFETFDGETWDNPYYKDFCSLYEGQKMS